MGNEITSPANSRTIEAFGSTKEEALNSLDALLQYKYDQNIVITGACHGYMYGGALLEVKFDTKKDVTKAYVDLM